jgi:hypothetical protein
MCRVEAIEAEALSAPMPDGLSPEFEAAWVLKNLPNCCRHDDPAGLILDFFSLIQMGVAGSQAAANSERWLTACKAEKEEESVLLRDIFGNPFRPLPAIDPAWLTWSGGTVRKLAEAIYDERAFDRLPVLADALEDAGCSDAGLLGHLRGPGPHARGCWALDLLLGKS